MNAWRERYQEGNNLQKHFDVHHQSWGAGGVMEMVDSRGMHD